jgi:hypothetical protein
VLSAELRLHIAVCRLNCFLRFGRLQQAVADLHLKAQTYNRREHNGPVFHEH